MIFFFDIGTAIHAYSKLRLQIYNYLLEFAFGQRMSAAIKSYEFSQQFFRHDFTRFNIHLYMRNDLFLNLIHHRNPL